MLVWDLFRCRTQRRVVDFVWTTKMQNEVNLANLERKISGWCDARLSSGNSLLDKIQEDLEKCQCRAKHDPRWSYKQNGGYRRADGERATPCQRFEEPCGATLTMTPSILHSLAVRFFRIPSTDRWHIHMNGHIMNGCSWKSTVEGSHTFWIARTKKENLCGHGVLRKEGVLER